MAVDGRSVVILVVDDDEIARQLLRHVLRSDGARVLSCDGVESALQVLATGRVDILISECLDAQAGLALLEKVRDLWPLTFRVLLMSTPDPSAMLAAIDRTGADRILLKTMTFTTLRHVIADLATAVRDRRTND